MPSVEPTVSAGREESDEDIQKAAEAELKMNGLVLSDQEVAQAMEAGIRGRFIPAELKKDGGFTASSSVVTSGELATVLNYSKRLIATMAEELAAGRVQAVPSRKNQEPCSYCPYGVVCGREYGPKDVERDSTKDSEALIRMERALEKGENPNG